MLQGSVVGGPHHGPRLLRGLNVRNHDSICSEVEQLGNQIGMQRSYPYNAAGLASAQGEQLFEHAALRAASVLQIHQYPVKTRKSRQFSNHR